MRSRYTYLATAMLLLSVVACSILQKKDTEKDARAFLVSFQNNLSKSDAEILKQFDTPQSSEALLTAIRILQNKENAYLQCTADFEHAQFVFNESEVNILITVNFKSVNLDHEYAAESSIGMVLKPKDGNYVITNLDGEIFYKTFADLRNDMQYSVEQTQALKDREPIFAIAKQLQQKFDTVIWYTTYNQKKYFYVVQGTWDISPENKSTNYKMGLVDETGGIVVPIEYQLIGCLGFDFPNLVEVKKDGKVGYYDLTLKQVVVQEAYDMIIPYAQGSTLAIVKSDTTYGWVSDTYVYKTGFPTDAAQKWVNSFGFIPSNLKLKGDSIYAYCEIPREQNIGYGILVPPSYLVKSGLFDETIEGISTTSFPYAGWTDYMETKGTKFESISDQISAVMTTITERYIEGREEFYTYDRMVFVGPQHDTLEVNNIAAAGEVHFKRPDSTLLELSYLSSYYYEGESAWPEYNMLNYTYFQLGPGVEVKRLTSHRDFSFTQFVKMDSSYLSGDFKVYVDGNETDRDFVSTYTIEYMRNEILADYGFIFADEESKQRYEGLTWYKPQYESIESFREEMSEIDRHNLEFLDKVLSLMQKPV